MDSTARATLAHTHIYTYKHIRRWEQKVFTQVSNALWVIAYRCTYMHVWLQTQLFGQDKYTDTQTNTATQTHRYINSQATHKHTDPQTRRHTHRHTDARKPRLTYWDKKRCVHWCRPHKHLRYSCLVKHNRPCRHTSTFDVYSSMSLCVYTHKYKYYSTLT